MLILTDVWGFDDDAVKALQHMKPQDLQKLINKYSILLDSDSDLLPQNAKQSVGKIIHHSLNISNTVTTL